MDKLNPKKPLPFKEEGRVPQLQVQTGLSAGASVESCLEDMYYWQNQYYSKCGYTVPTPYGY